MDAPAEITHATDVDNVHKEEPPQSAEATSTEFTPTVPTGTQPHLAEPVGTETPHTEPIPTSETSANPIETQATIVKPSEETKREVWGGVASGECQLPSVTNVTLTNLTEFAPQDPNVTSVNLENCVYGLTPAAVMTSLANQQLRPIANQFGANTTTLFAAGNYPHIITTPSQAGLQGFATAGAALSAVPAGVLYAQTGPQPSPMAGFSLVTQPIHYQTAALNAAVKTSSSEQTATTEQVTSEQQQQTQQQQQQSQSQAQQQQQQATQQADGTEIQSVQNIAFATGNTFPAGSYAGVIPAAQAYGNAYMAQQQGVAGQTATYVTYPVTSGETLPTTNGTLNTVQPNGQALYQYNPAAFGRGQPPTYPIVLSAIQEHMPPEPMCQSPGPRLRYWKSNELSDDAIG
ncbi:Hypothetical predicted protein [Paramuricea clavata]|nr:Hypothetical predicted protein [Paramuricea clavata]